MSTLTNQQINATYNGLIKTTDNAAITAIPKELEDGVGNALPIEVGTTQINFTADVDFSAATVTGLDAGVTSIIAGTNVTIDQSTGDVTISASGGGGGGTLPAMDITFLPPFKGVAIGSTSYNSTTKGLTDYTIMPGETVSTTQAVMEYVPLAEGDQLTAIVFGIQSTLATVGSLKVGIYSANGTTVSGTGTPFLTAGTLLKDLGTVSAASTGSKAINFTGVNAFTMPAGQQYGGVWIIIGGDLDIDGNITISAWSQNIHDGNGGNDLGGDFYRSVGKTLNGWDGTFKDYTSAAYGGSTSKRTKLLYA